MSEALAAPQPDAAADAVVRAFWVRAKPLAPSATPVDRAAQVIDLDAWTRARAR